MKKFLIAIVLLFGTQFYAQSIDSIIKKRSENFESNGIKDYFFYETYCVGYIKTVDLNEIDCSLNESSLYVFWKEKETSFFQEINLCDTPKIKIDNKIVNLYLKEATVIQNEKIKTYQIGKDNIVGGRVYQRIKSVDHSCHSKIYFYTNSDLIEKHIDEFDLTTENEEPNINFDRNNNLKMVQLAKYCDEVIKSTIK